VSVVVEVVAVAAVMVVVWGVAQQKAIRGSNRCGKGLRAGNYEIHSRMQQRWRVECKHGSSRGAVWPPQVQVQSAHACCTRMLHTAHEAPLLQPHIPRPTTDPPAEQVELTLEPSIVYPIRSSMRPPRSPGKS